jgi:hypothetical protein
MTQGVILHLSHMFGTKWGRMEVAGGGGRERFLNRELLLNPEDVDDLGFGDAVEFEQQDRTHGSRAVRLTIVGARKNAASGAEG